MQQVRLHRDLFPENNMREGGGNISINRTDLPSYINDHPQPSQRYYHDRLESLEREMASLKGQVHQSFASPINEHELNRTLSSKKPSTNPIRVVSPPRLPSTHPHRKLSNDEIPIVSTNDGPFSRALPQVPVTRSKTFHNSTLHPPASPPTNSSEEANFLRSYKVHIEQVLRKDAPPYSDIKVPNYSSIDDVMKANEQLLVENDRLRSELNRLKTESILLLRSMRTATGIEPNLGNERIMAERERQELAIELARQVEENKRLRRSLLAQSAKFLTLRQSNNSNDASLSASHDHRLTPESAPQPTVNFNRIQQTSKSTRFVLGTRGMARPRTFNNGSHDPVWLSSKDGHLFKYDQQSTSKQALVFSIRQRITMQFQSITWVFTIVCLIVVGLWCNGSEGGKALEHANLKNHRVRDNSVFAQRLKRRASTTYQRRKRQDVADTAPLTDYGTWLGTQAQGAFDGAGVDPRFDALPALIPETLTGTDLMAGDLPVQTRGQLARIAAAGATRPGLGRFPFPEGGFEHVAPPRGIQEMIDAWGKE